MSDTQLAEYVGVDVKTVGKYRRELEVTMELPESTTRTGRDGRTIDTANIGRRQPEPEGEEPDIELPDPDPAPDDSATPADADESDGPTRLPAAAAQAASSYGIPPLKRAAPAGAAKLRVTTRPPLDATAGP